MIDWSWLNASLSDLFMIFLSGLGIYIALLVFTRMSGLRSFSKLSSFDFSITVAFGTVVASTLLSKSPSLLAGAFALSVLFAIQFCVSRLRRSSALMRKLVDNEPILLMARDRVLSKNLTAVRMTNDDLNYKLRAAGITHKKQVLAVVMETTGDVSVLKAGDDFDMDLLHGVRDAAEMTSHTSTTNA